MHPDGGMINYTITEQVPAVYDTGCCVISMEMMICSDKRKPDDYPELIARLNRTINDFISDTYDDVSRKAVVG